MESQSEYDRSACRYFFRCVQFFVSCFGGPFSFHGTLSWQLSPAGWFLQESDRILSATGTLNAYDNSFNTFSLSPCGVLVQKAILRQIVCKAGHTISFYISWVCEARNTCALHKYILLSHGMVEDWSSVTPRKIDLWHSIVQIILHCVIEESYSCHAGN